MSLPSERQLLNFLNQEPEPVLRRDLAKAFNIKGEERRLFRTFLSDLTKQGKLTRKGKAYTSIRRKSSSTLTVLITDQEDNFFIGIPVTPLEEKTHEPIMIRDSAGQLNIGHKALVRLNDQKTEAPLVADLVRVIRATESKKMIGRFCALGDHGTLQSLSKKDRHEYPIAANHTMGARDGDIVEVTLEQHGKHRFSAKVVRLLNAADEKTLTPSDLAILEHDLPHAFSDEALKFASKASKPTLGTREDLRHLPLVTIDDKDARDFDDAVWATPDHCETNPGGWQICVAIADVSHYVKPGTALDKEARERGNSVYFPDQVVPMLPETLSNDLCSLKPDVDRACFAVFMTITKTGKLISHQFTRGLMKSAKRLTYHQTQEAIEGQKTDLSKEFIQKVIEPLYGAYNALKKGRHYRGVLELNIPEQKLVLDKKGHVTSIESRPRLSSHQLIEEFMVLANVASASTLDQATLLCMFRVHDQPAPEKVDVLRQFLKLMNIDFSKGQRISPKVFNALLKQVAGKPQEQAVNELVLRSQAQAIYTPDNIGHFGLGLARYAHFTSPIRRYADLLVHRALTHYLEKKPSKSFEYSLSEFAETGEHLSLTERRAAKAERQSKDRFVSQYLADKIDEVFEGRISGIGEIGLFILLTESGGDAFLPTRLLPHDYYFYNAKNQSLHGKRTKKTFQLGDIIKVRLIEANPLTGNIIVTLENTPRHPQKRSPSRKFSQKKKASKSFPKKKSAHNNKNS